MEFYLGAIWLGLMVSLLPWKGPKSRPDEAVTFDFNLNFDPFMTRETLKRLSEREEARKLAVLLFALAELVVVLLAIKMFYGGYSMSLSREMGSSFQNSLTALSVACGMSFLIYVGFIVILKTFPYMQTRGSKRAAVFAVMVFSAWSVGTSSWYAFMWAAGQQALGMHVVEVSNRLGQASAGVTSQLKAASGKPEAMEAMAAGFAKRAGNEVMTGGGTGARGAGLASQTFEGAAAVLSTGAAGIRSAAEKAQLLASQLREKVQLMQKTARDRTLSAFEREAAVLGLSAEVQALMSAMNDSGLVATVESSIVALRNSVTQMGGGKSAVGKRQQDVMAGTRADLEAMASDLEAMLKGFGTASGTAGADMEMVSLSAIAWAYKHHFIPELIIAVGIELFAPWSLAWLAIMAVERRKPRVTSTVSKFLTLDDPVNAAVLTPEELRALPAWLGAPSGNHTNQPSNQVPEQAPGKNPATEATRTKGKAHKANI